jgi:hypothetical protein
MNELFIFSDNIPKKFITHIPIPIAKVPHKNNSLLFCSEEFSNEKRSNAAYEDIIVKIIATIIIIGLEESTIYRISPIVLPYNYLL